MILELNAREAEIVRQLIDQSVRELGHEIHHAHSREVRERLTERRQILNLLLVRTGEAPAETAASG